MAPVKAERVIKAEDSLGTEGGVGGIGAEFEEERRMRKLVNWCSLDLRRLRQRFDVIKPVALCNEAGLPILISGGMRDERLSVTHCLGPRELSGSILLLGWR
jgi:hypothetical protein